MGYKIRFGAWQRQNTSPLLTGEDKLQASFCEFLTLVFGEFGFYSVPNGAYKSKRDRKKFKATGLKRGVPDLHIPIPMYNDHPALRTPVMGGKLAYLSLYIETKQPGKYAEPKQKEWHAKLREQGHRVEIIKDLDALQELICTCYPTQARRVLVDFPAILARSRFKI
jgi:hypothetical protein